MCMPSPGTTSDAKCAESWNCAVSAARTMSHSKGISECRHAGPLIALITGTSMFRRFIKRCRPSQWMRSIRSIDGRVVKDDVPGVARGPENSWPVPVRMTTRFSRSAPMSWNASGSSPCGRNPQRSDWPSVCSVTWSTPLRRSIRTVLYLFAYSSNALISTFFPRLIAAPQPAGPQPRDGLRRALRSDRPRHAGAVEDRLVDAARGDAVARRVELGDLALERAVEAVRRAAPGRQHDRVDGPDASLHAGIDVRDDHGRALDGAELGARRENDAPSVKPRVERRDGG